VHGASIPVPPCSTADQHRARGVRVRAQPPDIPASPPGASPPSRPVSRLRSRYLTAQSLLEQCRYIYGLQLGDTAAAVGSFNRRFGGLSPGGVGASRVLFLRYSDDPWQPVQPNASIGQSLPLVFTDDRNGSCAHCGAGCTEADLGKLDAVRIRTVRGWLGLR
jgi:hypothetical protein